MKIGWKKISIWAVAITILATPLFAQSALAAELKEVVSANEVARQMKDAAQAQLVANVFKKCVTAAVERNGDSAEFTSMYDVFNFNFITGGIGANKAVHTGAWLEQQVQGKIDDGAIYCNNDDANIINVFAGTMGVSPTEVVCKGAKPGILKAQKDGKDISCESGVSANGADGVKLAWNTKTAAMKHLAGLYGNRVKENNYAVKKWADIDTFTDSVTSYYLYLSDFEVACGTMPYQGDSAPADKTLYSLKIKAPDVATGKLKVNYYSNQGIVKDNWVNNWQGSSKPHSCLAVAKKINNPPEGDKPSLAQSVQNKFNALVKDGTISATESSSEVGKGLTKDQKDGDTQSPCSKAAGSLAWITCSVIRIVGSATSGMYDYIENNFLQTNVGYMDSKSGTHTAWETFRNLANIFFAIVLLIIILSQITGFGISNYGIKKLLPSLIVVAVLVNISFFLCQIAVDLSNIVGNGMNRLFETLKTPQMPEGYGDGSIGGIIGDGGPKSGVLGVLLNGAGTVGAVVGSAALILTAPSWILGFGLVLVSAAVSVIFFFLLLGMRQAGIILLVALAPIAIICYALPNTKNLFDRWWKMLSGLLLLYPICGALMGGGQFASRLLLSNISADEKGTFFYVIVAMLVQTIPFFFVPTLLKSSFAAIGNLGNKVSAFGRGMSKLSTGTIKKSDAYKNAVARGKGMSARMALRRQKKLNAFRENMGLKPLGGEDGLLNKAGTALSSKDKLAAKALGAGLSGAGALIGNAAIRRGNRLREAAFKRELDNFDRSGALAQGHARDLAKMYTAQAENDGTAADLKTQRARLDQAMAELTTNKDNLDARARFMSAAQNLSTSEPGRKYVNSAINGAILAQAIAGNNENEGIKWAAGTVLDDANKEYKVGNPSIYKNLEQVADGSYNYNANDIINMGTNQNPLYANKKFAESKMDEIGAKQFMDADDIYQITAMEGLGNGSIPLGDKTANNLISKAREIRDNENLSPKGNVEQVMNRITTMPYVAPAGNDNVNTVADSSIHAMISNPTDLDYLVRGIEDGTIGKYKFEDSKGNPVIYQSDRNRIINVAKAALGAAARQEVSMDKETADKIKRIALQVTYT